MCTLLGSDPSVDVIGDGLALQLLMTGDEMCRPFIEGRHWVDDTSLVCVSGLVCMAERKADMRDGGEVGDRGPKVLCEDVEDFRCLYEVGGIVRLSFDGLLTKVSAVLHLDKLRPGAPKVSRVSSSNGETWRRGLVL